MGKVLYSSVCWPKLRKVRWIE